MRLSRVIFVVFEGHGLFALLDKVWDAARFRDIHYKGREWGDPGRLSTGPRHLLRLLTIEHSLY